MSILKKKPKGPTYINNGTEVTIPFPVKKVNGYYTSMKDIYQDQMNLSKKSNNNKEFGYNDLLNHIIKEEGGTPEQYKKLQNYIAFHESAGTMDPTIKQKGGGPGRGKYQFEEGKNAGGKLAVTHTFNYLTKNKLPIPKWLKDLNNQDSVDFSKLSEEQQDILFLGHYKEHPKADFNKVVTGKESIVDFWGKYHQTQNDPIKKAKFLNDMERYDAQMNNEKMSLHKRGGLIYHK